MKNLHLQSALLLFLSLLLFNCSSNQGSQVKDFSAGIDHVAKHHMDFYNVLGSAIAVIEDGHITHQAGCGVKDVETKKPVTTETVFNIASITKTVTAWGVMNLVEEGKLSLDDPINQYLEEFKLESEDYDTDEVTIRRLLSHSSGLDHGSFPGYQPKDDVPSRIEVLSGAAGSEKDAQLVYKPGAEYRYTGVGYILLELAIENVTGKSFEQYMEEAIFIPLEMQNSSFAWTKTIENVATLHDEWQNTFNHRKFPAPSYGGLNTTIEDLAKFAIANLPGQENPILEAETIQQMQTPVQDSYGLGYTVEELPDGTLLAGHSGYNHGWQSLMQVDPKSGNGLVMLTNSSPSGWESIKGVACEWVNNTYDVEYDRYCQTSAYAVISKFLFSHNVDQAIQIYCEIEQANPDSLSVSEQGLNALGYRLLMADRTADAIGVFKLYTEQFPKSFNAYDSLGEAYKAAGMTQKAITNYEKSLELNPDNENAKQMLKSLYNS